MTITVNDTTPEPYAAVVLVEAGAVELTTGLSIEELDALILDLTAARHDYLEAHP